MTLLHSYKPREIERAIFIKGLPGDAEEPGDHDHTDDMRRDPSQYAAFEVVQLGPSL